MTTLLTAGAAGLLLGCPVALIWRSVSRRLGPFAFWSSCQRITRTLLNTVDARELVDQYGQLLKLLARYVARNVLLTTTAALPVLLVVMCFGLATEADAGADVGAASLSRISGGPGDSFWLWMSGPEAVFFIGLGVTSTVGIFLFPKRPQ
jgi:hypothetical protein